MFDEGCRCLLVFAVACCCLVLLLVVGLVLLLRLLLLWLLLLLALSGGALVAVGVRVVVVGGVCVFVRLFGAVVCLWWC